jgi:MazG family protein
MKLTRGHGDANRTEDVELPPGLEGLRALMDRLLSDEGCPWDRAQTLDTLRPFLLEETCEVLDAMNDPVAHREELGDLLFQIVFQAALREREGAFDLDGVIGSITDKLVRRHPHVFGPKTGEAPTLHDVERIWAAAKARERQDDPTAPDPERALGRIPRALPPLPRAAALQARAAELGFDWPDVTGALDKLHEELAELDEARRSGSADDVREELGDLMFVMVRVASKLGVDPDAALRDANAKFERRFTAVLGKCAAAGQDPERVGLDALEAWWQEAKRDERSPSE